MYETFINMIFKLNTNNIRDIPYVNQYGNITLSNNNHQKSGIELTPISNQQNVITPTHQPKRTSDIMNNLLTTEVSSMEELLDNALKMEQLLANPSTTDLTHPTCTPPDNETLLSAMISSMKQIVIDTPTSLSFQTHGRKYLW